MATNLALASITATGATQTRTFGDRLADIINVKDYGAKGDGSTDDTSAIQAAFNAAFGTWASPHGTSSNLNKPVFFPSGTYIVNPTGSLLTINSCVSNGGNIEFGFTASHGLSVNDNIYVRGVVGTGSLPGNANAPQWVKTVNDSTHVTVYGTFSGTYTSGGTAITPCLRLKAVAGGMIFGSSRQSTIIQTNTTNCTILHLNGFNYSEIREMAFSCQGGGVAVDYNWNNSDASATISSQGNIFYDCVFSAASGVADAGLLIGVNGAMSSENAVVGCQIGGCTNGIIVGNGNALNNTMFGGQVQSCTTGILMQGGGTFTSIVGVSFESTQGGQLWDIHIVNSADFVPINIIGCRSEDQNFLFEQPGVSTVLNGCGIAGTGTVFANCSGPCQMNGCFGGNGALIQGNGFFVINNQGGGITQSSFPTTNFNPRLLRIDPRPVIVNTAASHTLAVNEVGAIIQCNSASAQTVTIAGAGFGYSDNGGNFFYIVQEGAGAVTIATTGNTIKHLRSLTTTGQYDRITLESQGSEVWYAY